MQKTVLVGVTGCIAAYKSAELVRALQKRGLRVKVVMTEHATHFVDPLTFRSLTHEPVAVGCSTIRRIRSTTSRSRRRPTASRSPRARPTWPPRSRTASPTTF